MSEPISGKRPPETYKYEVKKVKTDVNLSPFGRLPAELITRIFLILGIQDPKSLANCTSVCWQWKILREDPFLLKTLIRIHFPYYSIQEEEQAPSLSHQWKNLQIKRTIPICYRGHFANVFQEKKSFLLEQQIDESDSIYPILCNTDNRIFVAPNILTKPSIIVYDPEYEFKAKLIFPKTGYVCTSLSLYKQSLYGLFSNLYGPEFNLFVWDISKISTDDKQCPEIGLKTEYELNYTDATWLQEISVEPDDLCNFAIQENNLFLSANGTICKFQLDDSNPLQCRAIFQEYYLFKGYATIDPNAPQAFCLTIHNQFLLIGKEENPQNPQAGLLEIWDTKSMQRIGSYLSHCQRIVAIKPINDWQVLIGCINGTMHIFDLHEKKILRTLDEQTTSDPSYELTDMEIDRKYIVHIYTTHANGDLKTWDYHTGRCIATFHRALADINPQITSFNSTLFYIDVYKFLRKLEYRDTPLHDVQLLQFLIDKMQKVHLWSDDKIKHNFSLLPEKILHQIEEQVHVQFPELAQFSIEEILSEDYRNPLITAMNSLIDFHQIKILKVDNDSHHTE
jgi:hypothetical protein